MRLTLRTLLAYLDDTLDPAKAHAIGQKIAESPAAQELIDRIKEVVRRRRLMGPPLNGADPKFDPNSVAEYIDSVLPAEQLQEFEEICLGSDLYLAEIAACHQILSVVLSEPSSVPPTARQRMYGLVKGPESIPSRRAGRGAVEERVWSRVSSDRDEADETLLLGLPFFSGQGPWYRRWMPAGLLVLLLAGLAVAMYTMIPPSSASISRPNNEALAAASPGDTAKKPESAHPQEAKSTIGQKPENAQPPAPSKSDQASHETKTPKPEAGTGNEKKPEPAPAGVANPEKAPKLPDIPPSPEPIGPRKVIGKYYSPANADPSILLFRPNEQAAWQRGFQNDPVTAEDHLVSLPGYRSKIVLENVDVTLLGSLPNGTARAFVLDSAATFHATLDANADLTFASGRIAIANMRGDGPAVIRIRFANEAWLITLDRGGEIALERVGFPSLDLSKDLDKQDSPPNLVELWVVHGQTDLRVHQTHQLMREGGPNFYVWRSDIGHAPGPINRNLLPPWAGKEATRPRDPAMAQALASLSKNLNRQAKLDVVLAESLSEESAASQELAVYCLGAAQDLPDLLEALANENHPRIRVAAIITLRNFLGQGTANATKVYQELVKKYHSGTAITIMHLLHEFSAEQRREPETYEELIERLKSTKLPIRQLADWQLHFLPETAAIAATIPYDPAGGTEQRERAYDRWKALIPNGHLPSRNGEAKPKPRAGNGAKNGS